MDDHVDMRIQGAPYSPEGELAVPPAGRVYVNRDLRMANIKAFGFDLDHTLAHYDPLSVGELAFSATILKLIDRKGYPEEIQRLSYDPDFIIRGLVVDLKRGNILKMDYHNYVHRAFHGRKSLGARDRKRIYAAKRFTISKHTYSSVDTIFHIPEVYLYVSLIDFLERRSKKVDYKRLFLDIREMIDLAHSDNSIKSEIVSDPGRFIRGDRRIFDVFECLRKSSKKLFLLTNSEEEYTDSLMSYLMASGGPSGSWRDFFDIVVVKANKPGFFSKRQGKNEVVRKRSDGIHEGGNAYSLEARLGCRGDRIMYFGDHTYGDILKAKKIMGWRTGMIVPELAGEIGASITVRKAYNRLVSLSEERRSAEEERVMMERGTLPRNHSNKAVHQETVYATKLSVLARRIERFSEEIDRLESICQFAYNPNWGSIFREGKQISRFGHQVRDFACIYMHKVSSLLNYPVDYYFQAKVDFMPHELLL